MTPTSDDPQVYQPDLVDLHAMNRVLRHRLRNLCAGMTMALDKIAADTADVDAAIGSRCQIMTSELERLEHFTRRMDLLFDRLPAPEPLSLYALMTTAAGDFSRQFPFCSIAFDGPQADLIVRPGTWVKAALQELLGNAGQAAGAAGTVSLAWQTGADLTIRIGNDRDDDSAALPTLPPRPFTDARGRHDGMGLAIAWRLCQAMNATLTLESRTAPHVVAVMTVPAPGN